MYTKITQQPFHGERDIILAVRDFVKQNGYATFDDIRQWLPNAINLLEQDQHYLEATRMVRINKIIQNLQNHQTLEMLHDCDIVSVRAKDTAWKSGFATRAFARQYSIPIMRQYVNKTNTHAHTARRRSELDSLISQHLFNIHHDLGEPLYDASPIDIRMEILNIFENDPAISLNIIPDITEEILLNHII